MMRTRWFACVLVVLSLGTVPPGQARQQRPPPASARPADKDAYVLSELSKLFAGAGVRIGIANDSLIGSFASGEMYDAAFVTVSRAGSNAGAEPDYRLGLFSFPSDAAARRKVQEMLLSLTSPVAATKTGYDEFHSDAEGRTVGRFGSFVAHGYASSPNAADAALTVLAKNVQANPSLFSSVVRYASSMHFGDTAPLKAVLSGLETRLPELLTVTFDRGMSEPIAADLYGANSVEARYTVEGGSNIRIVAKAYDADVSAKSALRHEMNLVSVGPDVTKAVRGGTLFEYTCCSAFQLHVGAFTFYVHSLSRPPAAWATMQKVSAALAELSAPR